MSICKIRDIEVYKHAVFLSLMPRMDILNNFILTYLLSIEGIELRNKKAGYELTADI
jgi:hypothetical protein